MNLERLLGSLVGGAFGARSKRSSRAARFLTGGSRSWLSASRVMTAAALGWGAYEIYRTHKTAQPASTTTVMPGASAPPPIPPSAARVTTRVETELEPLRRILALLFAAARCDGDLGEEEYAAILAHARAEGAEDIARDELDRRRSLEEIGSGVPAGLEARELYQLAFGIVRADEDVNGAERVWLARLAQALKLAPVEAAELERDMTTKIDRSEGAT